MNKSHTVENEEGTYAVAMDVFWRRKKMCTEWRPGSVDFAFYSVKESVAVINSAFSLSSVTPSFQKTLTPLNQSKIKKILIFLIYIYKHE